MEPGQRRPGPDHKGEESMEQEASFSSKPLDASLKESLFPNSQSFYLASWPALSFSGQTQ